MILKMNEDTEHPPSMTASPKDNGDASNSTPNAENYGLLNKVKSLFGKKAENNSLRETIEEYIEELPEDTDETSISVHEKTLISNILELRDMTASDVMVPRADIIAISHETTKQELFSLLSERQYSRLPVYKDTLDHVIGTIHVKDILASLARDEPYDLNALIRDIPIISPAMPAPDLLLQMRITKKHMVLVIDEFGGIDGLITIGDMIEAIVGEINDEYNPDEQPEINTEEDGTVIADARVELEEFEEMFGSMLTDEEREESETLGGLVFFLAGRVPTRGEILTHKSGMKFEILEADPRRVNRLTIHNIPSKS